MSDPFTPSPPAAEYLPPVQVFVAPPRKRRTWLYVLFFLLTLLTTTVVGSRLGYNFQHGLSVFSQSDDSVSFFPIVWALRQPSNLLLGLPFSLTLMLILFCHEMGHYLYCRHYRVYATLPFFVPFPSLIGTLGAFIRIKSPIRSRSALFDIGIAGPIAGFVVACGALAIGLGLSRLPRGSDTSAFVELGYPLIFSAIHHLMQGAGSVPLSQLELHPVAIAAWVGMFATALNLLPGGQLDGGHIVFSLAPRMHSVISTATIIVLLPLCYYFWGGWLLWAVLLRLSGMRHPIVPEWPTITSRRKWMALVALAMLILTFSPAPIRNMSLPEMIRDFRGGR